ncbi:type IV pilus modification PilV family protein [Vibrio rumoiensis]|uniref:Pilus assembly protein PilV n=1 Tax=Vibrio rumoiensis 1S-45 TaxID=1188252 RepID=A0A1E5E588_9VIBR|nr:prepilin-type N-terminal cleavage/methylation domain-containing protein [Vibrio rumoiensis]OEF28579.1 pilus assembly protein PilV [Vibrio rumoiensis 1S-45]
MTSKQKGFSLIEVLITFIILIVGIMGLVKLQTYMERQADFAENSIKALHLAESQLEFFRTRSISGASGTIAFSSISEGTYSIVSGSYTTTWTVTDSLSGALKTVDIETGWDTRWNDRQSVALKTMISQYNEFDN